MEEKFDLEYLIHGLNLLSQKMEEKDLEELDLYVIGGFCMLVYGHRNLTRDIDAYFDSNPILDSLIKEVGIEIRNPDWLNNNVSISSSAMLDMPTLNELLYIDGSFQEFMSFSRIKVYLATVITLIYTKLLSFRTEDEYNDLEDLASLLVSAKIPIQEVINQLSKFKRQNDDFQNMVFNILLIAYKCNLINDSEYEKLYEKYM